MNAKIRFLLAAFLSAILALSSSLSLAAALEPGDIVITTQIGPAANNDFGLVVVDPTTGNRTILSDNSTGTGPDFTNPTGVAIEPDGDVIVSNLGSSTIFRVDPATGDRTIVSSSAVGSGPAFSTPYDLVEANGTIFVSNGTGGNVLAVDPVTGNRSVFSGQSVGTGKQFFEPIGVTMQGQNLVVADYANQLFQVDLATGNRVNFFQYPNDQNTPEFSMGVAINSVGKMLLSGGAGGAAINAVPGVFLFDQKTATYSLVSGGTVGTGPTMGNSGPTGIATEANGTILLNEVALDAVLSIDPNTGNRTILSDATHGTGPGFSTPNGIAVVPNVPEPSSIALLAIGAIGLAVMARCSGRNLRGAT